MSDIIERITKQYTEREGSGVLFTYLYGDPSALYDYPGIEREEVHCYGSRGYIVTRCLIKVDGKQMGYSTEYQSGKIFEPPRYDFVSGLTEVDRSSPHYVNCGGYELMQFATARQMIEWTLNRMEKPMKKEALMYFTGHPWFGLNLAPKVKREVDAGWFDGLECDEILERMLNKSPMTDSVIAFKKFALGVLGDRNIDYVDSDLFTKDVCEGFFEYVKSLYAEWEAKSDDVWNSLLKTIKN